MNALADVPGTFEYVPGVGTVLAAGPGQSLTASFSPLDTANYTTQSASVSIDVVVPEVVSGDDRLVWEQALNGTDQLDTIKYALYVDGVRTELTDVSCAMESPSGAMLCGVPMPDLTPGLHTLEINTFIVDGLRLWQSPRSEPILVIRSDSIALPGVGL
jgi:hypothetical protein